MPDKYLVIGAEVSPFSVKVRSYFRFKSIPHEWVVSTLPTREKYQSYFKIPVIPLVITPEDQGIQDSTPIIEKLETLYPDNSIYPTDTVTGFVSSLLEEFGDEWGNKWMFHLRWAREADQLSTSTKLAKLRNPNADEATRSQIASDVCDRMKGRVWFVGSNEQNAPLIESGFEEALELLEAHLAERPYLLGARPCFGDFGLWGQIYNAWTDPTAAALINAQFPNVLAWIQRMLWPRVEGDFESWPSLAPTLMPFLSQQVGARFMPWTLANLDALTNGQEEFSVDLLGKAWTQKPQKYHAKSLNNLRAKYAEVANTGLDAVLEEAGCLQGLKTSA